MNVKEIEGTRNQMLAKSEASEESSVWAQYETAIQLCRIADALENLGNVLPLTIREESSNLTETIRRKIL